MENKGVVFIVGATGQQGGAVVRNLLKQKRKIRVLTRSAAKADALAKKGAEVVEGDMTDRATLAKALQGASGLFAMTTPFEGGIEAEVQQGIGLADAAKEAGISHIVYTSVQSADRKTNIPHFDSKWQVEQHIQTLGLRATILRPVFFMENFATPWFWPSIAQGKVLMAMQPGTKLQMVAVEDIGAFGAAAFIQPERFIGKVVSLAGDELTMPEVAAILTRVLRRSITSEQFPMDQAEAAMGHDMAAMFKWFNDVGYNTDIAGLKQTYGVSVTSFESWAQSMSWPSV